LNNIEAQPQTFHNMNTLLTNESGHPTARSLRAWTAAWILSLILAANSRADQFDTLRLTWQTNLINNGGSLSSIESTATSDWNSMDTNASRTYLWSDLPFGSDSANIVSTFQRLQAMALAWAAPGSSLQGNAALAGTVARAWIG
jgi:hypothetical protein